MTVICKNCTIENILYYPMADLCIECGYGLDEYKMLEFNRLQKIREMYIQNRLQEVK